MDWVGNLCHFYIENDRFWPHPIAVSLHSSRQSLAQAYVKQRAYIDYRPMVHNTKDDQLTKLTLETFSQPLHFRLSANAGAFGFIEGPAIVRSQRQPVLVATKVCLTAQCSGTGRVCIPCRGALVRTCTWYI